MIFHNLREVDKLSPNYGQKVVIVDESNSHDVEQLRAIKKSAAESAKRIKKLFQNT